MNLTGYSSSKDSDTSGISDSGVPQANETVYSEATKPETEAQPESKEKNAFDFAKALEKSIDDITNKTNKRFRMSYRILIREYD